MPLSTVLREVKPISVTTAGLNGSALYKFPLNFVGTVRVKALPNAVLGSNLTIQLGEWLSSAPPPPPAPPPGPPGLCGTAYENAALGLACPKGGGHISQVVFASYGTPSGSCDGYHADSHCDAKESVAVVEKACLGKPKCDVMASNENFGGDPCVDVAKWLSVQVSIHTYSCLTATLEMQANRKVATEQNEKIDISLTITDVI